MKFLILFLFPFLLFSDTLSLRINSKAQDVCYLKNPNNGLQSSDYSPTITGQTFRQEYESPHTTVEADATCDEWQNNPYVNIDVEVYKVIATMECQVNSEEVDVCGGDNPCPETYYWTVERQYNLDVDCQAICEIPRKADGTAYEKVANVGQSDCTVPNIQSMLDSYYPDTDYVADATSYLTCSENVNLQGCYITYHIEFDGNNDTNGTDNNNTDSNNSNSVDMTETNNKLDGVNNSINQMSTELGTKIDANGQKIDELGTKIDANGVKIDNLGTKLDIIDNSVNGVANAVTGVHGAVNGVANAVNGVGNEVSNMSNNLGDKLDGVNQGLSDINDKLGSQDGKTGNLDVEIELDGISELEQGFGTAYDANKGEASSFLGGMISKYVKFHMYDLGLPTQSGCSCTLDNIHIVKDTPVGVLDIDFASVGLCSKLDTILGVFKYAIMLVVYILGLKYIREIF